MNLHLQSEIENLRDKHIWLEDQYHRQQYKLSQISDGHQLEIVKIQNAH